MIGDEALALLDDAAPLPDRAAALRALLAKR